MALASDRDDGATAPTEDWLLRYSRKKLLRPDMTLAGSASGRRGGGSQSLLYQRVERDGIFNSDL